MPDSKITALASIGTGTDPANDPLVIVDVSDVSPGGMSATGTTKKVTLNNLLSSSPTATGNFTITGALTVDTSTLKVDSANDRVGIGTASPASQFHIFNSGATTDTYLEIQNGTASTYIGTRGTTFGAMDAGDSYIFNSSGNDVVLMAANASGAIKFAAGGSTESMRLNATGLGVGTSPSYQLHVLKSQSSQTAIYVDNQQNNAAASSALTLSAYGGLWNLSVPHSATFVNPLIFKFGSTEMMRIDSSGNVGVGVTPSAWGSYGKVVEFGGGAVISDSGNNECSIAQGAYNSSGWKYKYTGLAAGLASNYQGTHVWYTAPSGTAGNAISWTQAMTLDASGNLLVGTTGTVVSSDSRFRVSATAVPAVDAKTTAATQAVVDEWNSDTSGDNLFNRFWTESSPIAFRGSISYNRAGGLVAYNTTSDYRAKDIIGPVSNSGSLIDSLKVYVGKMKGATIERPMLIAHELQEVAPYAVSGEKDAVDADGKPKYQQMDASALVPLLIAEIKSLRARVQTLETR